MKKLYFLLLISANLSAQTINFSGKLADQETKKPIVYANISFLDSNKGISTLEDGTFNLKVDKKLLYKKIHISCLNYKDTIVLAKELQNKTLFLKPKNFQLDEVLISKRLEKELTIDKYKRRDIKSSFGAVKGKPWIVTKFFKFDEKYKETPFLKEVIVYFDGLLFRHKSKFRVRLFKKDTISNKPSLDLIAKDIIVKARKIDGKVKIDISKFDLEFPQEGFFIGLERLHIPYNFHEYTYTKEGGKKKFKAIEVAPSFGATYTKDSIQVFSSGKWRSFYFPQKFYEGNQIQPAISLTLSN
ncbi:carboxypeptidase-like regulatory domain-containing protein [uncultured Polaribacter sp.]|uniref:carboxypeptidase-like regulatory domain-containing protein n=1 Tax=uncultured Polaribacter sp. TaxID=174711 RepID=UPI002607AC10|nr:carboxypeptidase-like regulatory domain-containing protein [uncultured Polaribacter sp.]